MARKKTERTMTVGEVEQVLDTIAPPEMAQDWDQVGLMTGDRGHSCRRVVLCIDLAAAVMAEAEQSKPDLIIAYHPPIFRPFQRILADSRDTDSLIYRAIRSDIAVYSPHTALDAAPGGTNDVLAELCGLSNLEPFEYVTGETGDYKLVTFTPPETIDAIAAALALAGAGQIGDYEMCSYRLKGQGTFFGTTSTDPQVGRKGQLEKVEEIRLEMVAPKRRLPEIINTLLSTHPYEEPAYDLYPLADTPSFGIGRVGQLPEKMTLGKLAGQLKKATGSKVIMIVGKSNTPIGRAAVCVGSAGRLPWEKPRSADCDVIVTGEIRHHDALTLQRLGKSAIALGHWESERPVLKALARRLKPALDGVEIMISRADQGPFRSGDQIRLV